MTRLLILVFWHQPTFLWAFEKWRRVLEPILRLFQKQWSGHHATPKTTTLSTPSTFKSTLVSTSPPKAQEFYLSHVCNALLLLSPLSYNIVIIAAVVWNFVFVPWSLWSWSWAALCRCFVFYISMVWEVEMLHIMFIADYFLNWWHLFVYFCQCMQALKVNGMQSSYCWVQNCQIVFFSRQRCIVLFKVMRAIARL